MGTRLQIFKFKLVFPREYVRMLISEETKNITDFLSLKEHYCRYETIPRSPSSHEYNMPKVSHYNTVYFLRYTHIQGI